MNISDELMCVLLAFGIGPDDLSVPDIFELRLAARYSGTGLSPRERAVLRRRVGVSFRSRTLREVAAHFGITPEEVKQIELKARKRFRRPPGGPNDGKGSDSSPVPRKPLPGSGGAEVVLPLPTQETDEET